MHRSGNPLRFPRGLVSLLVASLLWGLTFATSPAGQGKLRQRYIARRKLGSIFEESKWISSADLGISSFNALPTIRKHMPVEAEYFDSCGKKEQGRDPANMSSRRLVAPRGKRSILTERCQSTHLYFYVTSHFTSTMKLNQTSK